MDPHQPLPLQRFPPSTTPSKLAFLPQPILTPSTGNIIFDFILSPTKGDSTSTSAQELMLWLEWEGGQLPIGWDRGPAATIDSLFGTSWKLYEDVNGGNGMTVVRPSFALAIPRNPWAGDIVVPGGGSPSENGHVLHLSILTPHPTDQHSLLPIAPFHGTFTGDLKAWFEALVHLGRFTDTTYVNIGNAG